MIFYIEILRDRISSRVRNELVYFLDVITIRSDEVHLQLRLYDHLEHRPNIVIAEVFMCWIFSYKDITLLLH